jgi:S1-C subfamily serine protease
MDMAVLHRIPKTCLAAALLLASGWGALVAAAQKEEPSAPQLPEEIRAAKIYRLPEHKKPGEPAENPVIYKSMSYQDINFERLTLSLSLSIKPVERAATVRKIYFQDVRVSGIPVHIETFEAEFKLSKKEVVDLPAPLKCSILFAELDSLNPVKEIVNSENLRVTGQSFIEVKLSGIEKLALRTKQLVLPVNLNEEVPVQMFSGNPLLKLAASKILDALTDPSSAAALALARERLARLTENRALVSLGKSSLYLLYCEYLLRNPQTQAAEKFSQSGSGFLVSADGKLLTAKRVVQPWKFDPELALMMERFHLELDPQSYKVFAWPAGSQVLSPEGQPDFQSAVSTDKQTLKLLKTAPDRMQKVEYRDPDSAETVTLNLHAPAENDAALLQVAGGNFQPLALSDPAAKIAPDVKIALLGFPFGLNQPQAEPQIVYVQAALDGGIITVEHQMNPGESGAPLVTPDGKVLGLAGGENTCLPIEVARTLTQ